MTVSRSAASAAPLGYVIALHGAGLPLSLADESLWTFAECARDAADMARRLGCEAIICEVRPVAMPRRGTPITRREQQILALISQGLTNREIGQALTLTEKTVKNHVSELLDKLDAVRRTQLAAYAARM